MRRGSGGLAAESLLMLLLFAVHVRAAQIQPGDYLQDTFLRDLRRTRSPVQALGEPKDVPQAIDTNPRPGCTGGG